MKTIRIWFNHWFSTAYHIIKLIKQDTETNFHIIGSSSNADSIVKLACDEWYYESDEDDYINFCINFCKEHSVDIFAPRHNQLLISKHKEDFAAINVKLLVDDYDIISVLHSKISSYQLWKENNIGNVPDYKIIRNVDDFACGYKKLSQKHKRICFKFTSDEGGGSFRIIDNYVSLFKRSGCRISYDQAISAISASAECPEIIMMPVLIGDEVSVDCLKTQTGIIMIPRIKGNTRIEHIRYDREILDTCVDFYNKIGLECPCNIQFKYSDDNIPYFLEINTRMSGGIQLTCLASGINIPNIAINKLIGINKSWIPDYTEKKVTHIEMPTLLNY